MDGQPVAPIRLVIRTSADPEIAWTYLTDPDRVQEWFTAATAIGEIGEAYVLDFGDGSVVQGEIVALDPGRLFAHRWAWLDADRREETLVTWRIQPVEGGGSEIELIHDGWDEAGADAAIRDDHEAYWSGYLDDLRDLLEDAGGS